MFERARQFAIDRDDTNITMTLRRRNYFVAWFCVLAAVACSRSSDEDQIRAVIDSAEQAAEARDTSDVMQWVGERYQDDLGNDRAQLRNLLRAFFLMHPKIELLVNIKDVKIETATRARVHIELSMLGTELSGDSTSLTAKSRPLRIDFRKIDSKWQVVRVERRRD